MDVFAFVEEQEKQEDAMMNGLEDLILEGWPVSAAGREAWRRWATGAKRKKKEEEEEAPESFLLSIFLAQEQGARGVP